MLTFFSIYLVVFFLRIRPPPSSTRTDTPFPYTTLFRSLVLPAAGTSGAEEPFAVDRALHKTLCELQLLKLVEGGEFDSLPDARRVGRYTEVDRKSTRLNSSH